MSFLWCLRKNCISQSSIRNNVSYFGRQNWEIELKIMEKQFEVFHIVCLDDRNIYHAAVKQSGAKHEVSSIEMHEIYKQGIQSIREGFHGRDLMVVVGFSGFLAVFWRWFFLTFRQSLWPWASSEDSKLCSVLFCLILSYCCLILYSSSFKTSQATTWFQDSSSWCSGFTEYCWEGLHEHARMGLSKYYWTAEGETTESTGEQLSQLLPKLFCYGLWIKPVSYTHLTLPTKA